MMATFAEFTNYDLPDNAAEDSYSIWPALLGKDTGSKHRPALIADTSRGDFSIRRGSSKLIKLIPSPRNRLEQVDYELYDLDQDPYETTNLADANPHIVEQLKELLDTTRRTGLRFLDRP